MSSSSVFTKALNPEYAATSSCIYECYPDDADLRFATGCNRGRGNAATVPKHQPAELKVGRREIRTFQLQFLAASWRVLDSRASALWRLCRCVGSPSS